MNISQQLNDSSKLEQVRNVYNYVLYQLADPRTRDLPMLGSPIYGFVISAAYLYFVCSAGPRFMKNRKPFDLKNVIRIQNVFQVIVNTYIVYELFAAAWLQGYRLPCTPMDYSTSPNTMRIIYALYVMYYLKFIDYIDTVIFTLRRKEHQVTFVHVFHHVGIILIGFISLKYAPGGQSVFSPTINAIVHAITYSYHTIATLGPKYKQYLFPRKYLFAMQLVEFIMQFIHALYTAVALSCDYPRWICAIFLPYLTIIFILTIRRYRSMSQHAKQKEAVINGAVLIA